MYSSTNPGPAARVRGVVSPICVDGTSTLESAPHRMVEAQMKARMLITALLMLGGTPTYAEVTVERLLKQDIDRREQERRERRWDEPLSASPLPSPVSPPAVAATDAGPCFPVTDIRVLQGHVLPARPLQRLIAAYQGRCLNATDLQALQQGMNSLALARGLVTTRVVIPEQNLASGLLVLEVWPGHLESYTGNSSSRRDLEMALPLQQGDPLDLRALEQAIDSLNRLQSIQASVELEPGARPGGSLAVFTIHRHRPWHLMAAWDSEAIEQHPNNAVRLSVTVDNPLRLADRIIIGGHANLQDAEVDNSRGSSIDYDLPVGWWRLSAGADQFDYRNPLTAGLTTFVSSGRSQSVRLELGRTLWRDGKHRLSAAVHGKQRINDNFIDDVVVGVSTSRLKAMGLRADISRVAAPWVMDASVGVDRGDARLKALPSPVDDDYTRVTLNARMQYHWPRSSLSGSLNGQWSDKVLLPSEQLALAGQVRGYAPLSLNAATALSSRIEWARPVFFERWGFSSVRPQVGAEFAWAPDASGNADAERLSAVTTGITVPWKAALGQLQIAAPLNVGSTQTPPDDWQLDASVSVQW